MIGRCFVGVPSPSLIPLPLRTTMQVRTQSRAAITTAAPAHIITLPLKKKVTKKTISAAAPLLPLEVSVDPRLLDLGAKALVAILVSVV